MVSALGIVTGLVLFFTTVGGLLTQKLIQVALTEFLQRLLLSRYSMLKLTALSATAWIIVVGWILLWLEFINLVISVWPSLVTPA